MVGVFMTWTKEGAVSLNGAQGPNNGWIVLLVAVLALVWTRALGRGSWIGVIGVFGAAVAMAWTGVESWLDNRAVLGASAGLGLILSVGASVVLGVVAVANAPALDQSDRPIDPAS